MTNPWDVIEAKAAEKSAEALYTSIGHALSIWESMEQQLSYLFGFFCVGSGGGDEAIPAKRAYGSVITFRGRSDMLRSAAEAYFAPFPEHEMKGRFFDLLKLAGNLSPRRNEIAHGCVCVAYYEMEPGQDFAKMSILESINCQRWLHCPPEYATNKHAPAISPFNGELMRRRKYSYSSREIDHYRRQFELLRREIWDLILAWAEKYPEADILPPL